MALKTSSDSDSDATWDSDYENNRPGEASDDGYETPTEAAAGAPAEPPVRTPKRSTSFAQAGPPSLKAKRARLQREPPPQPEPETELEQQETDARIAQLELWRQETDARIAQMEREFLQRQHADAELVTMREFQRAAASAER